MSLTQHPEFLERIGKAMARSVEGDWNRLTLAFSAVHSMSGSEFSIEIGDGKSPRKRLVEDEADEACEELREVMYEPGTGTWYNARFTLTPDGSLESEFDYDNPPFGGDADDALLVDDQEKLPRDPENLPAWHPSRHAN